MKMYVIVSGVALLTLLATLTTSAGPLPLKDIVQSIPLPNVGGTAEIEVRKKHWRLFQLPKRRQEEEQRQGRDPRWRYGPVHHLEIRYLTRPEWKK